MSEFKIAWLFPDTLFLHGERGNILALSRFAKMAGHTPTVYKVDFNTKEFDPDAFDVIFCAPGEISSFPAVIEWLTPYKEKLEVFVGQGRPLIVTGTSVALFGSRILRQDGSEIVGLNLISVISKENEDVYGDDNFFKCVYNEQQMKIIGNQIQMIDIDEINETKGERPFGELIYGYGNCGKNTKEGIIKGNSIFTNTLGPMLVCNPMLTIEIVRVACEKHGKDFQDIDFDMSLENQSYDTKKEFILTKESELTNCKR